MNKTLLTDLYQLTMGAVYLDNDKNDRATFDLFIRSLPPDWGYFVANGTEDALDYLIGLGFEDDDIAYLRTQGFADQYLAFLRQLTFSGDVEAVPEGTIVFPGEPLLRVTAPRIEAQLVETALLNIVNFQTMVATKAARVVSAAAPAGVVDFGLRRAQEEDAGMKGARAAYLAGVLATSNVKAGKQYGIPVSGTHAHSYIMSFDSELEAFRRYVGTFPDNPTLLIDTYDTLQGARNAVIVGRELAQRGSCLGAVRIDSGDLPQMAFAVRRILDEGGLDTVRIIATNDLNEYLIDQFAAQRAPIDGYGVGTELITAKPVAAIPGVYKLVADSAGAKIKLSPGKQTLPGCKQVWRQRDAAGRICGDVIALADEQLPGTPLLQAALRQGSRVSVREPLHTARERCRRGLAQLPDGLRAVHACDTYGVVESPQLAQLVREVSRQHGAQETD